MKQLIENICIETGISRFAISGGITMNLKMNKAVSDLDHLLINNTLVSKHPA